MRGRRVLVAVLAIAACGGGGPGVGEPVRLQAATAVCGDLFTEGASVDEAVDRLGGTTGECGNDLGGVSPVFLAALDCPDGRTLYWSGYGWGYGGATWIAEPLPPEEDISACTGAVTPG